MCGRVLKERGQGSKKTWMERVMGGLEKRFLHLYSGTLWFFLRHRWISALIWVVTLAGTVTLFRTVPKEFIPPGDSGTIFGVVIGRECASPQQMRALQDRAEEVIHKDPNVRAAFTMVGNSGFINSNMGLTFVLLNPQGQRPAVEIANAGLMGALGSVPGMFAGLSPYPVLQIATGASSQTLGKYIYTVSGVNPDEVYAASGKLMQKLAPQMGKTFVSMIPDYFTNTPHLDIQLRREHAQSYGVAEPR